MQCPNCQTEMKCTKHEDITTDICPSCGGVLLEKGELNVVATGMAGDIEYCSIEESRILDDKFPVRLCPKCPDQSMKKINLLAFSDLIFDYCEHCETFFLDKGEIPRMNEELKELTPHGVAQEYRDYREGHLVRIDRRNGVAMAGLGLAGMATMPVGVTSIRICVYFTAPLATDLRVFQEKWHAKLSKTFGLLKVKDISTGDGEFDKLFRVQGDDETAITKILSPAFRKAAVQFASGKPQIYTHGSLEVSQHCISYVEGPFRKENMPYLMDESGPIVADLLSLARLLET